jgi:hypothetical protein
MENKQRILIDISDDDDVKIKPEPVLYKKPDAPAPAPALAPAPRKPPSVVLEVADDNLDSEVKEKLNIFGRQWDALKEPKKIDDEAIKLTLYEIVTRTRDVYGDSSDKLYAVLKRRLQERTKKSDDTIRRWLRKAQNELNGPKADLAPGLKKRVRAPNLDDDEQQQQQQPIKRPRVVPEVYSDTLASEAMDSLMRAANVYFLQNPAHLKDIFPQALTGALAHAITTARRGLSKVDSVGLVQIVRAALGYRISLATVIKVVTAGLNAPRQQQKSTSNRAASALLRALCCDWCRVRCAPHDLVRCKGCKKAYYCSALCAVGAWGVGKHYTACKAKK